MAIQLPARTQPRPNARSKKASVRSRLGAAWQASRFPNTRAGGRLSRTWGESTLEVARWDRARRAGRRWAIAGAVVGACCALVAFAPANWLASSVASATGDRIMLADAEGTVWSGSAVAILTGGPGSRDARSLPGRIEWSMRPSGLSLQIELRHACCLNDSVGMTISPGWNQVRASVRTSPMWTAQWPAAWLAGLGTPFNTMQLGGALRLSTQDLSLDWVQGRLRVQGRADIELRDMSSRMVTLPRLGSYRLSIEGDPANPGTALVGLSTTDGSLRLSGSGTWTTSGLRLRGEATAEQADQAALNNLLNIIGRRDGARSIISIG